jgi:two-component system secretion response regulator SsrB
VTFLPSSSTLSQGRSEGERKISQDIRCALLADRHFGLSDGVRGLLETSFEVVVMVADELSLFEAIERMKADLAVVDLSLTRGNGLKLISQLRLRFPNLKLIAISVHDEPSVGRAAVQAGADNFVVKRAIATDLIPAVDAALAGERSRIYD